MYQTLRNTSFLGLPGVLDTLVLNLSRGVASHSYVPFSLFPRALAQRGGGYERRKARVTVNLDWKELERRRYTDQGTLHTRGKARYIAAPTRTSCAASTAALPHIVGALFPTPR